MEMLSFGRWHSFFMKAFFLKLEHVNYFLLQVVYYLSPLHLVYFFVYNFILMLIPKQNLYISKLFL